jgi:hypothetical protein
MDWGAISAAIKGKAKQRNFQSKGASGKQRNGALKI